MNEQETVSVPEGLDPELAAGLARLLGAPNTTSVEPEITGLTPDQERRRIKLEKYNLQRCGEIELIDIPALAGNIQRRNVAEFTGKGWYLPTPNKGVEWAIVRDSYGAQVLIPFDTPHDSDASPSPRRSTGPTPGILKPSKQSRSKR